MLAAALFPAVAQVAMPQPLPSPAPVPSPTATAIRLNIDRHALRLAPGDAAKVRVYGASTLSIESPFAGITVAYDLPSRTLTVKAQQLGSGTVLLRDPTGATETLTVTVLAPAGTVPSAVALALVGTPAPDFVLARVRAELKRAAHLCAGCTLDVRSWAPDPQASVAPGDPTYDVKLSGPNAADVVGRTSVHFTVVPFAGTREPTTLVYSDDPETVGANGVLIRSTQRIDAQHPARLYAYHTAADAGRNLSLIVRTQGRQSHVQLVGVTVGPYGDFNCVGHEASRIFLERRHAREGIAATVAPDQPYVLPLNVRAMPARTLVNAIYDVYVTDGDPVSITVVSSDAATDPLALADGPELPSDGHLRRGEYDLTTVQPVELAYTTGTDDSEADVGGGLGDAAGRSGQLRSLRPNGSALNGEYGVLRTVRVVLTNGGAQPATVYLFALPANGPDTITVWFADTPGVTEIGRIADPNVRTGVRAFVLPANTTFKGQFEYIDDGASWYPLELGLTERVPVPMPSAGFRSCVDAVGTQIAVAPPFGRGS